MKTKSKQTGYKNDMWNNVVEIDPAYITWAEHTKPDTQFSEHFLTAAGIEPVDKKTKMLATTF